MDKKGNYHIMIESDAEYAQLINMLPSDSRWYGGNNIEEHRFREYPTIITYYTNMHRITWHCQCFESLESIAKYKEAVVNLEEFMDIYKQ